MAEPAAGGAAPEPVPIEAVPGEADRSTPRRWLALSIVAPVLVIAIIAVAGAWGSGDAEPPAAGSTVASTNPTSSRPPATSGSTSTSESTDSTAVSVAAAAPVPSAAPELDAPAAPPPLDPAAPPVVARAVPGEPTEQAPPAPAPPWAWSTTSTAAGHLSTEVGCATGLDAGSLDRFFAERVGPLLGTDYQHAYPLGGDRYLWLFQDAFVDHGGGATRLTQARFVHNVALVQTGACFRLLHRGTAAAPASFEPGTGERRLTRWFWPVGGELAGDELHVFWVEMVKDAFEPGPGDGLGWHPASTWLARYDAGSLARRSFEPAPNSGVAPIFGYAVSSDGSHSYLFGNTFEQNLVREGGFFAGPHSATATWLARVPAGQLDTAPEYRTTDGWSPDPGAAVPIDRRYWVENPMQPRRLGDRWVSVAKVDGYWGEELAIDVALEPWGPWVTVERRPLATRNGDPLLNTYHAHLAPWLSGGSLVVTLSNNARDMARDAFPHPWRYRPSAFAAALPLPPVPPAPEPPPTTPAPAPETTADTSTTVTATSTTVAETTTTGSTTTTTPPPSTAPATTTTLPPTTPPTTAPPTTVASGDPPVPTP